MMEEINLTRSTILRYFQLLCPVSDSGQEAENNITDTSIAPYHKAAVLVGFVERRHGLHVIFTRRAKHLKHHPGQISFPGGKYEKNDQTIYHTAVREAGEEIGLQSHDIELIGKLPELKTISRFSVTPVVAFVSPRYQAVIHPGEVDEIFEVPLNYLLNPRHVHSYHAFFRQKHHRIVALNYRHYFIWGMTARLIELMQQHLCPEIFGKPRTDNKVTHFLPVNKSNHIYFR